MVPEEPLCVFIMPKQQIKAVPVTYKHLWKPVAYGGGWWLRKSHNMLLYALKRCGYWWDDGIRRISCILSCQYMVHIGNYIQPLSSVILYVPGDSCVTISISEVWIQWGKHCISFTLVKFGVHWIFIWTTLL